MQCFLISVRAMLCWKVPSLRPLLLLTGVLLRWRRQCSSGEMILTRKNRNTWIKACIGVTTSHLGWPGTEPGSSRWGLATSRLSHDMASSKLWNSGIRKSRKICFLLRARNSWNTATRHLFSSTCFRHRISVYQWIYLRFRTKFNVCSYRADITPLHEARIECFDFLKHDFACTNLARDKKYSLFLKTLDFKMFSFLRNFKEIKKNPYWP